MDRVYNDYYALIFKYILYLTADKELTHDLLQETFYRFYKNTRNVQQEKALLIKIARNLVYDYYRKKRLLSFLPYQKDTRIDDKPLPEEIVERGEEIIALYKALQQIKLSYRETIVLRYIEDFSVKEVAIALNCSEIQVKNNTARGLKALRSILVGGMCDGQTTKRTFKHSN